MKALLFAAGLGTRLKPFTNNHPKALAVVNGKTLLQRNIEYLASFGFKDIIINVHHFAEQIINYLEANNNFGCNITISHEKDEPLETGGGLKQVAWYFKDVPYFLVMNADILTNLNLTNFVAYHINNNKCLATLAVTDRPSSRCFLFNDGVLCGWRNHKTQEEKISKQCDTYSEQAFSGIQLINNELLDQIPFNGKFSLVDLYLHLAKEQTISAYNHSNDIVLDVGKPEALIEAENIFI